MTPSEVKLDVLTNTIKDMMLTISRKDKLVVQRHHVPSVSENERIIVPKHFATHPWEPKPEDDLFMYTIHHMEIDEIQDQIVMEKSTKLICMFDDIPFMNESLEYDHHNGNYMITIDDDALKKPTLPSWEEESQLYQ